MFQISCSRPSEFGVLEFEVLDLFEIWDLSFEPTNAPWIENHTYDSTPAILTSGS